jgi:hypothetical protein
MKRVVSTIGLTTLLLSGSSAFALGVSPSTDAFGLAQTLFLNLPGLQLTGAALSGTADQSGTFSNASGTYGLPNNGIVLSTGRVQDYAEGPNTSTGFTNGVGDGGGGGDDGGDGPPDVAFLTSNAILPDFGTQATPEQEALLKPISGPDYDHFDVVQLDITFQTTANISSVSFFATFGSEEFPEFVGSQYVDAFGLYVNGVNVAHAGGFAINIDHPDMTGNFAGTELDGILAPNGSPVMRFDVPINPGVENTFTMILGDTSDDALDTTVYLSSFGAVGTPGDTGGPASDGLTEFTPLLPVNPPDPVTGAFEIALVPTGGTVWVDPPVSVGYEYSIDAGTFLTIQAPSLATIADLTGYEVTFIDALLNEHTFALAAGATLDVASYGISSFTLSGIDPELMVNPFASDAFPLGITFSNIATLSITPVIEDYTPAVPLPAGMVLYLGGLLVSLRALWRRGTRTRLAA